MLPADPMADPMAELASSLAAPPAPRYACERMPPAPLATFRKGSTTVVKKWKNIGKTMVNIRKMSLLKHNVEYMGKSLMIFEYTIGVY